ncbi:hypothetical protein F511_08996 [Dorcoceras hygrometricum]|uniref:Uncharacterized protein n=1 Tax=Dorcoceras hygrometricum TaxID=472368 RepID=A0A2Z7BLH6_9LAMI|nr:hypothetical protein F511_08996 [Dorcoceras hygrometricum]
MGNCIHSCKKTPQKEKKPYEKEPNSDENEGKKSGKTRVKIILTKDELDWLLAEVKNTGGKRLEDVLSEIQRSRENGLVWRPRLDSIVEEMQEEME